MTNSVARPQKCYINHLEQFIKRHIRNRSTNQIAGNSLFSSEIILIHNVKVDGDMFHMSATKKQLLTLLRMLYNNSAACEHLELIFLSIKDAVNLKFELKKHNLCF